MTEEHSEEMKRTTEHITNLISEITLLNTGIKIKVNNLVKVHLNELDEPSQKQDKTRNDFPMSRDRFDVALASKDNELKKARERFNVLKKKL